MQGASQSSGGHAVVDEDAAVARIGDTVCCCGALHGSSWLHSTFPRAFADGSVHVEVQYTAFSPLIASESTHIGFVACLLMLPWPAADSNSHKTFETLALLVSRSTMRNGRYG